MKLGTHCSTVYTTVRHAPHHSASITPRHASAKVCTVPRYAAQCTMARNALTHKRHSYDKGQRLLLSLTSSSGCIRPQQRPDDSHLPQTLNCRRAVWTVPSALSTKGLSQAGQKFLKAAQAQSRGSTSFHPQHRSHSCPKCDSLGPIS